jgi:hypothetical protein
MHNNLKKWRFIIFCLFLITCKTHDDNQKQIEKKSSSKEDVKLLNSKFQGEFSTKVETEETTSGTASINYFFHIKNNTAALTTTTFHEPIICNGNYKIIENNNNILELYYSGNDENCKSKDAKFKIKEQNNKYFITGLGDEATYNEWIELKEN